MRAVGEATRVEVAIPRRAALGVERSAVEVEAHLADVVAAHLAGARLVDVAGDGGAVARRGEIDARRGLRGERNRDAQRGRYGEAATCDTQIHGFPVSCFRLVGGLLGAVKAEAVPVFDRLKNQ